MTVTLEDHEGTVSIGGRAISNLGVADFINGFAGDEELAKLVERLDKAFTVYDMEFSAEKTELMTTPVASTQRLMYMDRSLKHSHSSSTWAQMRVQSLTHSPE